MNQFVSTATLTSPSRQVFLSPHYDDIALSCGGTAALISSDGSAAEIALIFGDFPDPSLPLTAFASEMHEKWGLDALEVINARRREETTASAVLGSRDRYLPFLDAIYREDRYLNDDDLFGRPRDDEAGIASQIVAALAIENNPTGEIRFYAPLAIGDHVDHQHAYAAGRNLADQGHDVYFYEDLPYALIPGTLDHRLDEIGHEVEVAGLVDVTTVWEKKIDAIMAYPSQLAVIFGGYVGDGSTRSEIDIAMRNYAESVGGGVAAERFWRVTS